MFNEFAKYEQDFLEWRRDGYPGICEATGRYIDFLTDPDNDQKQREGTLWDHQWEAFLRVIYSYEILKKDNIGKDGLLLNIVTGGGKTAVMAAIIAWLRIAHSIEKFVLMCPNLIVRDRLEEDFEKGKVFKDRDLLPDLSHVKPNDFILTTLGSGKEGGWASLLSASVVLGNIHQFYQSNKSGQSNLSALMNGPDFVLFNDEAHNSPAEEYENTLTRMKDKILLRIDTTATPDRADGKTPDSDMIFEYGVNDALNDRVIKSPVIYQPDIKTVQLTYTDAKTGEKRRVEEIDWDEVERKGLSATQWVTDDEPMRQQMAIALNRLEEQERRAKGRYQPILFVIAVCKADAKKAADTLNKIFKIKTLLVTEDSDEEDRKKARELGRQQKTSEPYKAVVSILMLREGWDVPEVGVILLLRKFSSKVYGQQVIGRGLRRVRVKGAIEDDQQICSVVDHPKLEYEWLWQLFNSRVRRDVKIDEIFNETEDLPPPLPKQEIVNPEQIIEVPKEIEGFVDDGEFILDDINLPPVPLRTWQEVLDSFEYDTTAIEITGVELKGVTGRELSGDKWKTHLSAPMLEKYGKVDVLTIKEDDLRSAIKEYMLELSEELTIEAGYATSFKSVVYGVLMKHLREKFMKNSLGLADRKALEFTWKMIPQVKHKIKSTPGLVEGIIEYADQ